MRSQELRESSKRISVQSNQKLHEKLYRAKTNPIISLRDLSTWLKHGNMKPRDEASYLQDKDMFLGATYQYCNNTPETVNHLDAIECFHKRRHNEVVRFILFCNKYDIKKSKISIQKTENVEIRVDTRIKTKNRYQG